MVEAYASQEAFSWTRVEMLIELYDATISSLEDARIELAANRRTEAAPHLIRATRLLIGILSGLDCDASEVAQQVERICLFVVNCIQREQVEPGIQVLRTLKEGFQGIRTVANEMERQGKLPELLATGGLISVA